MLSYEEIHTRAEHDLLRQAYLLTGDPDRARRLADRALEAGRQQVSRHGYPAAMEHARAELVRAFVADPGAHRPPPPAGPARAAVHPDVAVWQALRRLSPRRCAVMVLRYDEGATEEQTAARLGTSAQSVRADVDAAMLTLRTALPGVADPWTRVADALSAAGRGWSDYTRPAPERVAEVLAAPRPQPPAGPGPARGRSRRPVLLTGAAVAVTLLAAALVVPQLGGESAAPAAAGQVQDAGRPAAARGAPRLAVPTAPVARGLLNWPARGALAEDPALFAAARGAWTKTVPRAEAPATGLTVLWAGRLDGRTSIVVQALDRTGGPRVAQFTGRSAADLALARAEPLHTGTAVLSLLPPAGPSGRVRVLVSPEAQVADGLLASDPMKGTPLRRTPVGDDGVSGVLPSPPGVPTCSRVVLLGLDSPGGPVTGARVLYSGVVAADMLGGMPMAVEVGSATLAAASGSEPETLWFADGGKLARKVPGAGTLTVASLGPPVPAQVVAGRKVSARAYELERGGKRYLGSVVDVGGRTVCTAVQAVRPAAAPAAWALRCPMLGGTAGLVHVVGTAGVRSVDLDLAPTPAPAGQRRYAASVARPDGSATDGAFAVVQVVPAGFPCGAGTLRVHRGDDVATVAMPVYTP